jgi:uncharacterized circularly permuted ATP-grasp superfamily protein
VAFESLCFFYMKAVLCMQSLIEHADRINALLARYGVKFGIYKNQVFHEQLFPFDPLPRIIPAAEFSLLEKGLIQRVTALNLFLRDIYGSKRIVQEKIIPEEFIFSSKGFLPQCDNFLPPKGIFAHISGIDLVQAKDKNWYILEDNLRIPSGASYPLIARKLCRLASPETFSHNHVVDNRNYPKLLRAVMNNVNTGGLNVILTPGRYNAAFFEHAYLAEKTNSVLAMNSDLFVDNNNLFYRDNNGMAQRVGALYRRISDEYLDPMNFLPDSLIGVPNILTAYRSGNVAIINAPGNGVADDKGIYYFVPKMIKFYLQQEPVLQNAPTYLMFDAQDRENALSRMDELVFKDVSEAGGYGVVFGRDLSSEKKVELKNLIEKEPRRFIAQEIIDFIDLPIMEEGKQVLRKADLRAFVLMGAEPAVWASGLTRFSRNPSSFIVNSSQGGGFKDTWVLSH